MNPQTQHRIERVVANTMILNMGPQHPATHGVLRVILELDGETVVKATPDIGFLHTGIEKTMESKTYAQVIPLTDRMDYVASLSNNLAYLLAVEKLLDIQAPPKAQFARVLLTELTRIASHLVWVGSHALDMGAMSMLIYAFREREKLMDIFELCSGQRMMTSYFRIGGLAQDIPDGFEAKVREVLETFPGRIAWFEGPDWKMHTLRDDLNHGHSLEIADFNGDGTIDIFVGEMSLGRKEVPQLYFYLNDGKGNLTEMAFDNPIGTHDSKAGDIGNTGKPSIIIKPYNPHNRVELWENVTE